MSVATVESYRRRWMALVLIGVAQMMVALDATIVTIALPSAQGALEIGDADKQWMITAYTVAFGGLVLLGGRVADYVGRTRAFLGGLLGFAAASTAAGAATTAGMLMAARAAQGAFAALLAPTALSLLAVTFTDVHERARAFAVYGTIAASGGAAGLIVGGLLTEYLSWRWCLYVNVPIAVLTAVGVALVLPSHRSADARQRLDVAGAVLATGGLAALVYACTQAVSAGWSSPLVLGTLTAATTLLGAFTWRESRVTNPLLPLGLLAERNRGGAYLAVAVAVAGMLGMFLFLTYYLQHVLSYTPIQAGLAFLPLSAAVLLSGNLLAARALPHAPPRALIVPGLAAIATAMLILARLTVGSGYTSHILPAEILLGLGMGCVFVPAISTVTRHVAQRDAGVAAAVINATQQIGGSIGTALLNSIAAATTATYLTTRPDTPEVTTDALVHGYSVAAFCGAGILAAAAILAAVLISESKPANADETAEPLDHEQPGSTASRRSQTQRRHQS